MNWKWPLNLNFSVERGKQTANEVKDLIKKPLDKFGGREI